MFTPIRTSKMKKSISVKVIKAHNCLVDNNLIYKDLKSLSEVGLKSFVKRSLGFTFVRIKICFHFFDYQ